MCIFPIHHSSPFLMLRMNRWPLPWNREMKALAYVFSKQYVEASMFDTSAPLVSLLEIVQHTDAPVGTLESMAYTDVVVHVREEHETCRCNAVLCTYQTVAGLDFVNVYHTRFLAFFSV